MLTASRDRTKKKEGSAVLQRERCETSEVANLQLVVPSENSDGGTFQSEAMENSDAAILEQEAMENSDAANLQPELSENSDAANLEPEAIEKFENTDPEPSIRVLTTDSNNSETECIFVLSERMADGTCVYEMKPHFQSKSNCIVPDSASGSASVQLNSDSDALLVGVDVTSDSDATLSSDSEIESRPANSRGRKRVRHENQWKQN